MSILLLGGRGKTSIKIARLLEESRTPFALASRSKSETCPYQQVEFEWSKMGTYIVPFESVSPSIKAIYIVMPPDGSVDPVKTFINLARSRGVNRFVLLSSSAIEAGGPAHGQVHQHLVDLEVEYAVLRPTWFMGMSIAHLVLPANVLQDNFINEDRFSRKENTLYSACEDGKMPFVSSEDIAAVGYQGLVDNNPHNTDHVILGPDLLSYDDAANILSDILGRNVTHTRLSKQEMSTRFQTVSYVPPPFADMLSGLDVGIAGGTENQLNDEVAQVTGRPPKSFRAWAEENRAVLQG